MIIQVNAAAIVNFRVRASPMLYAHFIHVFQQSALKDHRMLFEFRRDKKKFNSQSKRSYLLKISNRNETTSPKAENVFVGISRRIIERFQNCHHITFTLRFLGLINFYRVEVKMWSTLRNVRNVLHRIRQMSLNQRTTFHHPQKTNRGTLSKNSKLINVRVRIV